MSVFRRLPLWPLWLLALVPIAAVLLFSTSIGRSAIDGLTGSHQRWMLPGMTVEAEPPPGRGLIVTSLQSGSEAARSGIAVGDVIVAVDGRPIESVDQFVSYLRAEGHETVTLQVVHHNANRALRMHLVALAYEAGFFV